MYHALIVRSRPEIVYVNSHAECKIFACQVDPKTGQLKRLAEAGTGGQLPAHYTLHPNESTGIIFTHVSPDTFASLLTFHRVAHKQYGSGHVTSIPLSNGLLASDKPSAADTWVGPDIQITDRTHERQTSPRAHQAYVLPDGDVLIPDFGSDKVWRLRHDKSGWQVKGSIDFDLADGPRHCLLHPDGEFWNLNGGLLSAQESTSTPSPSSQTRSSYTMSILGHSFLVIRFSHRTMRSTVTSLQHPS